MVKLTIKVKEAEMMKILSSFLCEINVTYSYGLLLAFEFVNLKSVNWTKQDFRYEYHRFLQGRLLKKKKGEGVPNSVCGSY